MQTKGIYRQRRPEKTALYQVVRDHYDAFREKYNDRYGDVYGFFRPEIDREMEKYIKCGIVNYGFATIRCTNDDCGHEEFLPYSCKSRCFCPSCMQKNMLETGAFIVEKIAHEVPYRHIVFTIPKSMRKNFYFHRESLNDLSRIAWDCILTFMCNTLARDGRPGAIIVIATAGEYQDRNPHFHILTTDGIFTESGSFFYMPKYTEKAEKYLQSLWEYEVTKYVEEKKYVTPQTVKQIFSQRHTGFSVYAKRRVVLDKTNEASVKEFEALARYIVKPHFSLEAMEYVPSTKKVLYHGEMHKGKKRNFEIFDADDFIAAITSHIPNYRQRYVNYYGEYSSRARGKERSAYEMQHEPATASQREFTKRWAMLIRQVWEIDPLKCKKCGSEMRVVEYVREAYAFLYKKMFIAIGAWYEEPARPPPRADVQQTLELTYEKIVDESPMASEFADA